MSRNVHPGWLLLAAFLHGCDGGADDVAGSTGDADELAAELEYMELLEEESLDMEDPAGEASTDFEPRLGFALPPRGILQVDTGLIGHTSDGQEASLECASGQVVAGISGFATDDRVHRVRLSCVELGPRGNWVGEPQAAGSFGTSSGAWFSLVCDAGHAVTGISGVSEMENVSSLQIHCSKADSTRSTSGASSATRTVGHAGTDLTDRYCGAAAVSTGLYGRVDGELRSVGLVCDESPARAGRWNNPVDWPVQAVHALMTPTGSIMSYGFNRNSTTVFDYDLWDPAKGTAAAAHDTFATETDVNGFCNAAVVMPANGDILMPGGTKSRLADGVDKSPVIDSRTGEQYLATDMAFRRWYPTAVTLSSGDILVVGGRDEVGVPTNTPEVYSPETNEWRSLFGADTAKIGWSYPRLWVAPDGRVVGFWRNQVYHIDTEGAGSLTMGELLSPRELWSSGVRPAAMYRPGKLLFLRGDRADLVDVNGPTPVRTSTSGKKTASGFWSDLQVLPDGTVLAVGGSRKGNDAATSVLNPEIWDPDTDTWTIQSALKWPRLYHSTSVLLRDGTVLIAGGGNPGPITNYNAEIFSPPYLFEEDGSPATRPTIDRAPGQGAYGEQIDVGTSSAEVDKVTFIKMSSVTHSWNSEQRYMELPFSVSGDDEISVRLPGSPNAATPGFYLLFVLNEKGTPSEARIVKLGDEPSTAESAPTTPPPDVTTPPAASADNNVLVNGSFEQGKSNWLDCSDAGLSTISTRASSGRNALAQTSGACLYQEFPAQPGTTYTATCDAHAQESAFSSLNVTMLDATFTELAKDSVTVSASSYTSYGKSLTAGPGTAIGAVTLYSEGPTFFDACTLTSDTTNKAEPAAETPIVAPSGNVLANADFEAGKDNWSDCGSASNTAVETGPQAAGSTLKVESSGCLYQEFPVTQGKSYRMQCEAQSTGSRYSSITLQIADARYNELEANTKVVAPGGYRTYRTTLTAPASSTTGAVTVYSEDITRVSACYVEEI